MYALADCNNFFASCERVFRPELNGRPVIVLSNNDGCTVARSNEAKALGIRMGDPYFKLTAPTNEFVGFYPSASTEALMEYRDSPSRSMFCAAFSSLSWCVPHSGQTQSRTDRFLTRTFL